MLIKMAKNKTPTDFSTLNERNPDNYSDLIYWRKEIIQMFENRIAELKEDLNNWDEDGVGYSSVEGKIEELERLFESLK